MINVKPRYFSKGVFAGYRTVIVQNRGVWDLCCLPKATVTVGHIDGRVGLVRQRCMKRSPASRVWSHAAELWIILCLDDKISYDAIHFSWSDACPNTFRANKLTIMWYSTIFHARGLSISTGAWEISGTPEIMQKLFQVERCFFLFFFLFFFISFLFFFKQKYVFYKYTRYVPFQVRREMLWIVFIITMFYRNSCN